MTYPKLTPLAAALAFLAAPALADITADQVVESLTGQGYSDIVVADPADGMISATATRADGLAVTVVYDAVSGEVQSATAADATAAADAAPAAEAAATEAAATEAAATEAAAPAEAAPAEPQDMDDGAETGEAAETEDGTAGAGEDGQQGG